MRVTFEGREWEFDENAITLKQGIAVHLAHGLTLAEWMDGVRRLDARAIQASYWLMLQQNGVIKPIADCDCDAAEFLSVVLDARKARADERAAPEPEPVVPPVPTIPAATAAAAWPGSGYQADMTRQPQPPGQLQPPATGY